MISKDRRAGGQKLALKLEQYKGDKDAIILGLPRGGVVVAFEVAKVLGLPSLGEGFSWKPYTP